jgi:hypothetical protein
MLAEVATRPVSMGSPAALNTIGTVEVVGLQPDIILTGSTAVTAALQRETRTIPIVFVNVGDPVASGIVARLDRPNGNSTGFGILEATLGGKWLELLSEVAPGLKRGRILRAGRAEAKTAVRVSGAYPPPDPWPPQRGDCCGQRRGPCGPLAECEAKEAEGQSLDLPRPI